MHTYTLAASTYVQTHMCSKIIKQVAVSRWLCALTSALPADSGSTNEQTLQQTWDQPLHLLPAFRVSPSMHICAQALYCSQFYSVKYHNCNLPFALSQLYMQRTTDARRATKCRRPNTNDNCQHYYSMCLYTMCNVGESCNMKTNWPRWYWNTVYSCNTSCL